MSDLTVFYLHSPRLDLKINPSSARRVREQMRDVCVCVCVCVPAGVEIVECRYFHS